MTKMTKTLTAYGKKREASKRNGCSLGGFAKVAATYSPTGVQYHRRKRA